jgi:hypothetical protein
LPKNTEVPSFHYTPFTGVPRDEFKNDFFERSLEKLLLEAPRPMDKVNKIIAGSWEKKVLDAPTEACAELLVIGTTDSFVEPHLPSLNPGQASFLDQAPRWQQDDKWLPLVAQKSQFPADYPASSRRPRLLSRGDFFSHGWWLEVGLTPLTQTPINAFAIWRWSQRDVTIPRWFVDLDN